MDPAHIAQKMDEIKLAMGTGRLRCLCVVYAIEGGDAGMLRLSRQDVPADELAEAVKEAAERVGKGGIIPVS